MSTARHMGNGYASARVAKRNFIQDVDTQKLVLTNAEWLDPGRKCNIMPPRTMANIYRTRTTADLRTLRSKKVSRLNLLWAKYQSFFIKKEIDVLNAQVHAIDVELECRRLQLPPEL